MSGDWMDKEFEKSEKQKRNTQLAQQMQLHRSRLVEAKGGALWQSLLGALEDCAKKYRNRQSSDEQHEITFGSQNPHEWMLRTMSFPSRRLDVTWSPEAHRVEFVVMKSLSIHEPELELELHDRFDIRVDREDNLYFNYGDERLTELSDAVRVLLHPVLFPQSEAD